MYSCNTFAPAWFVMDRRNGLSCLGCDGAYNSNQKAVPGKLYVSVFGPYLVDPTASCQNCNMEVSSHES